MRLMSFQVNIISRDISYKMNQTEILDLKNTITEMKKSLEGLKSRSELAERMSKFENTLIEIIQSEEEK